MKGWDRVTSRTLRVTAMSLAIGLSTLLSACGDDDTRTPAATASPTATNPRTATTSPTVTATIPPNTSTPSATATTTFSATPIPSTSTPTVTPSVTPTDIPADALHFTQPLEGQLSLAGTVAVHLAIPPGAQQLVVSFDDTAVPMTIDGDQAEGQVGSVPAGMHHLTAAALVGPRDFSAQISFEAVQLTNPDDCEVLNSAECLLPFPSSRFLEPADTPTGFHVVFPAARMLRQTNRLLPVAPYLHNDGFSPTVQILMHFPGGVDVEQSNASRLLAAIRTYDARSLDLDSPTVLLDADTDERILHFIENDARAADVTRRVTFLRPGKSLTPGHHYIVAVRNLVHQDGTPVTAEPAFAALRDHRPTDIAAIESRRAAFATTFATLSAHGIDPSTLILAFDFVVGSDNGLTQQMLSMRDQAFSWLAQQTGTPTFAVEKTIENDCMMAGAVVWREIQGTYQVPLFLTDDPVTNSANPAQLNVDANNLPVANGVTNAPFTIAIPCSALANGGTPKLPLILGHGLFGDGRGFVESVATVVTDSPLIAGATDWRGLSAPDVAGDDLTKTFVGKVILDLRGFPALPDRLRQGQLNTLVLARMMKTGAFNVDDAFKLPNGQGALAGPDQEAFYLGGSLGGIMGLMFAALSPDVVDADVVVPAINFSLLLQRATPFIAFQGALELTGIGDPMKQALLLGLLHEQWVRGEPAGYATHITNNPLPGTNAKHILMMSAFVDQQVSNQGTEIAARTLGLPSLEGSFQNNLVQIPDMPGPLPSALVMYNTGSFDLNNPAHAPFIPPLANLQAQPNRCDPHGLQATIPAAIDQIEAFLQPGGQIQNFCNGICDAAEPHELPSGLDKPCDPLQGLPTL